MEILNEINLAVIAPFFVIQLILFVIALIAWIKTDKTNGPKWVWLLVILLINIIGPILFFIFGRRQD